MSTNFRMSKVDFVINNKSPLKKKQKTDTRADYGTLYLNNSLVYPERKLSFKNFISRLYLLDLIKKRKKLQSNASNLTF